MSELTVEKITLEISNSNEVVVLEVSSGGGGASIDDSAGLGVIDKTWSANKIKTEIANNVAGVPLSVFNALENKVSGVLSTANNNTQSIVEVNTRIDNTQDTLDNLESKVDTNTATILNKVDKEVGKGLSDENFTQTEKTKLASVGDITRDFVNDYLLKRG